MYNIKNFGVQVEVTAISKYIFTQYTIHFQILLFQEFHLIVNWSDVEFKIGCKRFSVLEGPYGVLLLFN